MREIKENIVYPARFQTESGGGVRITFPDFPELLADKRMRTDRGHMKSWQQVL